MAAVVEIFDPEEQTVLSGKYRVERQLGRGGMGLVVAARHLQLDERVAIKLMLPDGMRHPDAVARFMREARAAAKIKSEHVCRVSDVGLLDGGQPYMVLEYLEGEDLAAVVARSGPLPLADAVEYVLQACEAVAEAHALGIVHRDLKPSNLYLTRRVDGTPVIKVLDFGISKVARAGDSTGSGMASDAGMTRTAELMGSPLYMSPEQMTSSRDVDARSDIWALGVILYELLSGVPPFQAELLPQVCSLILEGQYTPLSERVARIPEPVAAAVARCLSKNRANRFANVSELVVALSDFAPPRARVSLDRIRAVLRTSPGNESGRAAPTPSAATAISASPPNPSGGTQASWGETSPPRAPRRVGAIVLGAVVLGAVVIVGAIALLTRGESPASTDPAVTSAAANALSTSPAPVAAPTPSPAPLVAPALPVAAAATPSATAVPTPEAVTTRAQRAAPRPARPPAPEPASQSATARRTEEAPGPAPGPPRPAPTPPRPAPAQDLGGRL